MMDSLLHGFAENNIQENEMKEDIKSMTLPELTTWMSALGEKGFRAKQLYNWMHKNLVSSFDEMTNLSGALKCDRKRFDALSFWKFRLHFHTSRLPYGLSFLCFYT